MSKLTTLQQKVEDYIEKNRIHLSSFATFDKKKFKNKKIMDKEIKHARIILSNKMVQNLMSEGKMKEYLKEFPPGKGNADTILQFEVFVFSAAQIRSFIDLIQNHGIINLAPESRIIH